MKEAKSLKLTVQCRTPPESPLKDKSTALLKEGYRLDFVHEPTEGEGRYIARIMDLPDAMGPNESSVVEVTLVVPEKLVEKFSIRDKGQLMSGPAVHAECEILGVQVSDFK